MSLWKFGNFEVEVDFTDADVLRRLDEAYQIMLQESAACPKVGKQYEIAEAQCAVYDHFFDHLFGSGTSEKMYNGSKSVLMRVQSAESLGSFSNNENEAMQNRYQQYMPNRQQRRSQQGHKQYHGKKR